MARDLHLDFDDVLIAPQPSTVNSREDVCLARKFQFPKRKTSITGLPIIAANMLNIGTVKVAQKIVEWGLFTALYKGIQCPENLRRFVFETHGIDDDFASSNLICLDVANGYTQKFIEWIYYVRQAAPRSIIMAGNVVTAEGVKHLAKAGADIIKVGLGSGAACLTRSKTGVGVPQLQAVLDCSGAARECGVYICSDGGHRSPGDVAKSYAAGADFVMLGSMFAGTEETGRKLIGNASKEARGGLTKYSAQEGTVIHSPWRGT